MPAIMTALPYSPSEPVREVLHGVRVTDPYRWLEDQDSVRTRTWIEGQTFYARTYLDSIPGRKQIRERVREHLSVETYDSVQKVGNHYFFRKRLANQEQPCIYMREGPHGEDQLLVDPIQRGTGDFTAVKPLQVSRDLSLLFYEVKQGGEQTGTFEILDIATRTLLPDRLPRGYLRGFTFAPDGKGFYYVHEALGTKRGFNHAAYYHRIGTEFKRDEEVFSAGADKQSRLYLISDGRRLGLVVCRYSGQNYTDFYVQPFGQRSICILSNAPYFFAPYLMENGRILAMTDDRAPNLRIIEVTKRRSGGFNFVDVVSESKARIREWVAVGERLYVNRICGNRTQVDIFDIHRHGHRAPKVGELACSADESIRLNGASAGYGELFFDTESFTKPIRIFRCSSGNCKPILWAKRHGWLEPSALDIRQVRYRSKDGTSIPMFLVGNKDVIERGVRPVVMTAYGGYGIPMTPRFSVFVTFLIERGCLFALPQIRGGSEFGSQWHHAAKRRNRQVAFDDFLSAVEWLIDGRRATPSRFVIFGGSNSGLLMGAALTQRPELFRAVVCMVPLLDMVRYHLFDNADRAREEFGTADDPEDFSALLNYSPFHRISDGVAYPATLIVSGDLDQKCNPLHARKMTARLQAATISKAPILLDYSPFRGHSPVLPLQTRIEALTDRLAFVCDQLQLSF